MNFVALDFETANEGRGSACSIGLVKVEDGEITDRYYTLIKPEPLRFSSWNIRIHGITAQDVADAPTFGEAWPEIARFIGEYPLVAHNASFDMSVLRYCLEQYGIEYPHLAYFCTVKAAKKVFDHLPNHKLNTVSDSIGFAFSHHNALEDAEACARILLEAIKRTGAVGLQDFCKKNGFCCGQLYAGGYKACK